MSDTYPRRPADASDPRWYAPSPKAIGFVRVLQKKLRIPDAILDRHCQKQFGTNFKALSNRQVSTLLDEMTRWEDIPAELKIAMGQETLPGLGL